MSVECRVCTSFHLKTQISTREYKPFPVQSGTRHSFIFKIESTAAAAAAEAEAAAAV